MPEHQQQGAPVTLGFTLTAITTEQFAVVKESFHQEEALELSAQLRFADEAARRMIGVFSRFTFGQGSDVLMIVEVGCHFEITEESWAHLCPDAQQGAITLPKGFAQHLALLTVGTARGVLHVRAEQTAYSMIVLPTIDVTDLVAEDVVMGQG